VTAEPDSVERQLELEARGRRVAFVGAVAAVVFQVAGDLVLPVFPKVPGKSHEAVLKAVEFLHANAGALLSGTILDAVGLLAMIVPLDYLYRATKFRRPKLPGFARVTVYAGPILFGVGLVALQVIRNHQVADYIAHHRGDYSAARQAVGLTGAALPALYVSLAGLVALIFSFVIVPLNAMRAGLLTRFMGVLGIIVGVMLFLTQAGRPASILRWFWLGALVYLFADRWPGGVPPAWRTGRAEPWPSARELREGRAAEREAESPAPEAGMPQSRPDPRSRKRRSRKRR
jgi:hypothetical protein